VPSGAPQEDKFLSSRAEKNVREADDLRSRGALRFVYRQRGRLADALKGRGFEPRRKRQQKIRGFSR
jgi:hypothetical protein